MKSEQYQRLLAFLERLDKIKVQYWLRHSRDDSLMVAVYLPARYWRLHFVADGAVEIERFRSNGHIDDESVLPDLFALWADDPAPAESAAQHDGTAGT